MKQLACDQEVSFTEALNGSVRRGIERGETASEPYRLRARRLKPKPGVDLDKALRLAGDLEDEETMRKLQLGK